MQQEEYEAKMIEAFVNKPSKTLWYQNAFSKFHLNGIDSIRWVWSWWAFFGGWAFLLYRKQYIPALVLFALQMLATFVPFASFFLMLLTGGFASYFIYKGYKKKKEEIEAKIEDIPTRIETMQAVGGYNQWVIWIYGIFVALIYGYILFMAFALSTATQQPF